MKFFINKIIISYIDLYLIFFSLIILFIYALIIFIIGFYNILCFNLKINNFKDFISYFSPKIDYQVDSEHVILL